jgi:hypothetical protein
MPIRLKWTPSQRIYTVQYGKKIREILHNNCWKAGLVLVHWLEPIERTGKISAMTTNNETTLKDELVVTNYRNFRRVDVPDDGSLSSEELAERRLGHDGSGRTYRVMLRSGLIDTDDPLTFEYIRELTAIQQARGEYIESEE